jgi:HEAT repeat protein
VVAGIPLILVLGIAGAQTWKARQGPAVARVVPDSEAQRTGTVERFLRAGKGGDAALRTEALGILRDDVITIGATADPAHLPTLSRLLKSKDAALRAAAAEAMAMIGPTAAQTADLLALLKDPDRNVGAAAREALAESFDPAARAAVDVDRMGP